MLNVGPLELLTIAALALVVLGPDRLPGALRQVGRAVGELRRISGGFQDELRRAMDETLDDQEVPSLPPLPEKPATPLTDGDPPEPPPVIPPEEAAGFDLPSDRPDDGDDETTDEDDDLGGSESNGQGKVDEADDEADLPVVSEADLAESPTTESSTAAVDDEPASVTDDAATGPNNEKPA